MDSFHIIGKTIWVSNESFFACCTTVVLQFEDGPYLNFARVGGFHMQGTSGRNTSELLRVLNNAADESLRLALWVKIDEKKSSSDLPGVAGVGRYIIRRK